MREIKFRAWDKATKNGWVPKPIKNMIYFGIHNVPEYIGNTYDEEGTWVKRFALMQYTGLKDKNGKGIFEGDILQWSSYDVDEKTMLSSEEFIVFENGQYWVKNIETNNLLEPLTTYLNFNSSYENVELIGNIYENPELLGGDN